MQLSQTLGPQGSIRFTDHGRVAGAWFPESRRAVFYPVTPEDPPVTLGRYSSAASAHIVVSALYTKVAAAQGRTVADDDGFDRWLARCSAYLDAHFGIPSVDDLPDWCWRDAYDANRRIPAAVGDALEAAGWV